MFREGRTPRKQRPPDPSRRQFLAGMVSVGVALPIERAFGKDKKEPTPEPPDAGNDHMKEMLARENEAIKILGEILSEMRQIEAIRGRDQMSWTPDELDAAHDILCKNHSERLQAIFERTHGDEWLLAMVQICLDTYQVTGLLKKYIVEHADKYRDISKWQTVYSSRAADYLPRGSEILERDIDPQGSEAEQGKFADYSSWSRPEITAEFRLLIDNPEIRTLLQSSKYTLAEAYSLIKAVIAKQHPLLQSPVPSDNPAQLAREFMAAEEKFKKIHIIGPETQHLIGLTYHKEGDTQFDETLIHDIGIATSVPEERINSLRVDANTDAEQVRATFLHSIATSTGETTVFCNTHGTEASVSITDTATLETIEIAAALIARVVATKNPETLKDVHLFFFSCSSHRFATNIVTSLRFAARDNPEYQRLQIPVEDLTMPQITAAAQEGRLAYTTSTLRLHIPGMAREGALTGAMMMHVIQPIDYSKADYTFFVGSKGRVEEIGQRDTGSAKHTG